VPCADEHSHRPVGFFGYPGTRIANQPNRLSQRSSRRRRTWPLLL